MPKSPLLVGGRGGGCKVKIVYKMLGFVHLSLKSKYHVLRIPNSLWKDPSICISFAWDTCKRHATFDNYFTNKATHNNYMQQIWATWSMYMIQIGLQGGEKGIYTYKNEFVVVLNWFLESRNDVIF